MMTDVSVIIPVYNARGYIGKAVESVLAQQGVDTEVVLVDDGSTDGSSETCDSFAVRDKRVIAVHQKNQGPGPARNTGLDAAHGEYVFFLDGDDWIPPDALAELLALAKKHDADIVCFDLFPTFDREEISCEQPPKRECVLDRLSLMRAYYRDEISTTACSKLYKASLWETVRFADVRLHEDAWTMPPVLAQCARAYVTNQRYYMYYQHGESRMHLGFQKLNFLCVECGDHCLKFARRNFPELGNLPYLQLVERRLYTLDKMQEDKVVDSFRQEYDEMVESLRKELPLLKDVDAPGKKRVIMRANAYLHPLWGWLFDMLREIHRLFLGVRRSWGRKDETGKGQTSD